MADTENMYGCLRDWAAEIGVTIQWFHEWTHGPWRCVTAFGYATGVDLDSGKSFEPYTQTVKWPAAE